MDYNEIVKASEDLQIKLDKFESKISLNIRDTVIDFKSIIGVLSLGIYMGEVIELIFKGKDEASACLKISNLIEELKIGKEVE